MDSSNVWAIRPFRSPALQWGARTAHGIHTCPHCQLELLTGEKPGFCCGENGKYARTFQQLPQLPVEYNAFIEHPLISKQSRILNLIFSFAAIETTHPFPNLSGPPSFVAIQGKVYHRYTFPQIVAKLPSGWVSALRNALLRVNPFVICLRQLSEVSLDQCPHARLTLQDQGSSQEIAAILNYKNTSSDSVQPRNLICVYLNGKVVKIPLLSRNWEPLAYPLLFPHATLGWGLPSNVEEAVTQDTDATQMWYYRWYLLHESRFRIFGRLTNEYLVDMFSRNIETRLSYIRSNQDRIRQADAALMGEGAVPDNDNVYLPSSFLGSNRWSAEQIADALAIAAQYGSPTFFITMTCNPKWPEITSRCRPGQDGTDIPMDVARVFRQKVSCLLKLLHNLFPKNGRPLYIVYAIEFQKRGYPHVHILVKYPKPLTITDIDNLICSEIPDDPSDAALIRQFMVHNHSPNYCLKKGSCRFKYPHPVREQSTISADGRVLYRRRTADDVFVVPTILPVIRELQCHINFEVALSSHLFQYLFKYVWKGPDYTKYSIPQNDPVDEIEEYWKARYLTAEEAAWRILGYVVSHKEPAVSSLSVHLQSTTAHHERFQRRSGAGSMSSLLRYFHRPSGNFIVVDNEQSFDSLTYIDYFQSFRVASYDVGQEGKPNYYREIPNIFNAARHHVILRSSDHPHVARLQPVLPSKGELFYFRILLRNYPGRSFDDFYAVQGVHHASYREAAIAAGLFADENESEYAIMEAIASLRTPRQLRYLFIHLLTNDCVPDPPHIWDTFRDQFCADFLDVHSGNANLAENSALLEMARILEEYGKNLDDYALPAAVTLGSELEHELGRWEPQLMTISQRAASSVGSLTTEQRQIFDAVLHSIVRNTQHLAFIDGRAGRGKTWVIKCLLYTLRSTRQVVLPTATSAFAAQQYEGGRTTHSTFKVPVNENSEFLRSPLSPFDARSELIRNASLIIWDEVPMANKAVLACVDETLRRIMECNVPFGGKSILLAGDFRQTCPVVRGAGRVRTVDASVATSPLWPLFHTYRLQAPYRNAGDPDFANFVDAIGDGAGPIIDLSALKHLSTAEDMIDFVYPPQVLQNPNICVSRNILAPTNAQIDAYNEAILSRVQGDSQDYFATDHIRDLEDVDDPQLDPSSMLDYAARSAIPGFPAHRLSVKTNGVYRLMRNLSIDRGLVKNIRVRVISLGRRLITVRLLPNANIDPALCNEDILLPRITFTHTLFSGHTLVRQQFPLAPAYATTFNSCQGLTLDKIAVDLEVDVFSHGQLYTALSRVRDRNDLAVRLRSGSTTTTNVTYPEILLP